VARSVAPLVCPTTPGDASKLCSIAPHEAFKGNLHAALNFSRSVLACVLAVIDASHGGSSTGAGAWDINAWWDTSNWD
jgi:hypothetical protein